MSPVPIVVAAALWLWACAISGCREVSAVAESLASTSGALAVISGIFLLLELVKESGP